MRDHVRFDAQRYLELKAANDLAAVQARWETKVLIMGDLNDEPADRSLVEHLQASSERDRVAGPTNDITAFRAEAADYRGDDTFLYNPGWKFYAPENTGTYFISSTPDEQFANRYQVLDQMIVSRGLLATSGLRLDPDSVADPPHPHGRHRERPAARLRPQDQEGHQRSPAARRDAELLIEEGQHGLHRSRRRGRAPRAGGSGSPGGRGCARPRAWRPGRRCPW